VFPKATLLLGSGVNLQNVRDYLPLANGFIVGTSLKAGGLVRNPVDSRRVAALARVISRA